MGHPTAGTGDDPHPAAAHRPVRPAPAGRAAHADRLAGYEQVAAALPDDADAVDPYSVATLRFGLAYERAVLEWFAALPPALGADPSGTTSGAAD